VIDSAEAPSSVVTLKFHYSLSFSTGAAVSGGIADAPSLEGLPGVGTPSAAAS
jgi:hypothetical protein